MGVLPSLFIFTILFSMCPAAHWQKSKTCSQYIEHFPQFECVQEIPLGSGGCAFAFLVKEKAPSGKLGVLKFIRRRYIIGGHGKEHLQEIRVLEQVKHPNIIRIYAHKGLEDDMLEIIEYGSLGTLDQFLASHPDIRKDRIRLLQTFRQLASAVRFLHTKGWVHTDLKPANVVIDDDWNLKLIDFDLALPVNARNSHWGTPLFRDVAMIDAPDYKFQFDEKVDVFSLGATFFNMTTGQYLIQENDRNLLLEKMLAGDFVLPEGMDLHIAYLIHKMLLKDRSIRYSMDQVIDLIDFALAQSDAPTIPTDTSVSMRIKDAPVFPESLEAEVAEFARTHPQRYTFWFKKDSAQKELEATFIAAHSEPEEKKEEKEEEEKEETSEKLPVDPVAPKEFIPKSNENSRKRVGTLQSLLRILTTPWVAGLILILVFGAIALCVFHKKRAEKPVEAELSLQPPTNTILVEGS